MIVTGGRILVVPEFISTCLTDIVNNVTPSCVWYPLAPHRVNSPTIFLTHYLKPDTNSLNPLPTG